jgi:hypothetical protein
MIAGTVFGFVEAAVVYYLRALMRFHQNYSLAHYKTILNLGFITFVTPQHALLSSNRITDVEKFREAATIVILVAIAYVAGKNARQRVGAFLISFACWDIMYYVFLKIIADWPSSLMTRDVFFLLPVTWIGPVITPLVIATAMLVVGIRLFMKNSDSPWN